MNRKLYLWAILSIFSNLGNAQPQLSKDYPIQPVDFSRVQVNDHFWAPKIKTNHQVTIPIAIAQSQKTGRIDNFKIAGGLQEGAFCSIYPFDDSDIYKIIEAGSYSLQTFPDPALASTLDSLIYYISMAQEDDGYLYTNRTINNELHPWAGKERWELVNELSHELYNIGHMYEAAVAHYKATGKKSLLDVAIKSADLVSEVFGPGKIENYPGHQEIEIGLVKLYRLTQDEKYLNLAKYFLDLRGKEGVGKPDRYNQSHVHVTDQTEAVGHAVRAAYMWTAMADVAAITGNEAYVKAINTLWHDVIDTKYYINGGIGATSSHEGFAAPYELPNMTAYCETCAGVGNAMWNHRMFLMTGDSKYIDVLERTMYNNILTGVSYEGDRFFYPNPLASAGQHERSEWFGCACCPPNVARFLPSMPGYIYAQKEDNIYVNLFISSKADFQLSNGSLTLSQQSELPWEGLVTLKISVLNPAQATIKIRIPGWAHNRPVPGDLYRYLNPSEKEFEILVNGKSQSGIRDDLGYVNITKTWKSGDLIKVNFPLEVKKVKAHPKVVENFNKLSIERGPLVYCVEWPDNAENQVLNLVIDEKIPFQEKLNANLFGGIYTITTMARSARYTLENELVLSAPKPLTLIPYHLWNNRGPGEMRIWLPTSVFSTSPLPAPTVAYRSKLNASPGSRGLRSIVDQEIPESSANKTQSYFHWWPKKNTWEWISFDFSQPEKISQVKIFWFADYPNGGTKIPDQWEVEYQDNNEWYAVQNARITPVSEDSWNVATFSPVTTGSIRIKVKLSEEHAAGIHEVMFE